MARPLRGILAALARERAGNIAIVSAASLPIVVGVLALGVDWGSLAFQKRRAQADTDLAAISAASDLADPAGALRRYAANNGLKVAVVGESEFDGAAAAQQGAAPVMTYVLGRYRANGSITRVARFTAGDTPANAVRVTMHQPSQLTFAAGFMPAPNLQTEAVAGEDASAAFSIGSRLASLDGGVLNAALGSLLGTTLSLDVMDYQHLLGADVDALSFIGALATKLHLDAGSYDDVLASSVSVGDFLSALADTRGLSADVQASIRSMASAARGNGRTIDLRTLFDLAAHGDDPVGKAAVTAKVGVLDLVSAAAAVADGEHQISLATGLNLPGLAKVSAELYVGEPPQGSAWFAIGGPGTLVRTAQTRLKVEATIGGEGLLSAIRIDLPLYLQVAYGEATLKSVTCTGPAPDGATVNIDARPGVAEAWIGQGPDDLGAITSRTVFQPARIVDAGILRVTGYVHANATNASTTPLRFTGSDIADGRIQTVSTHDTVSTLLGSLLSDLDLEPQVLAIPLLTPALVKTLLGGTIAKAAAPLDGLIDNLLAALGVRIGEADVRVTGVDCGRPVLVQ